MMLLKEHVPGVFQHLAFVANPRVCEAAASVHPVSSHSVGVALVPESFLPDLTKRYLRSQAQGTLSVSYLFSGKSFVTGIPFHLLEQPVNIAPSENPFCFCALKRICF